jgi:hypothetical protein
MSKRKKPDLPRRLFKRERPASVVLAPFLVLVARVGGVSGLYPGTILVSCVRCHAP